MAWAASSILVKTGKAIRAKRVSHNSEKQLLWKARGENLLENPTALYFQVKGTKIPHMKKLKKR